MRALFVPSIPWLPYRAAYQPDYGPNPFRLFECLELEGVVSTTLDPVVSKWNPLAGRGSLLEAMDPWRALDISLRKRNTDVIVAVFEGGAVPLVFLKALLRFKVPVVLWDIGLTENWRLRERVQNYLVPRLNGVLVLGSNQVPYIQQRWRTRATVLSVGHYVDTEFFRPTPLIQGGCVLSVGDDVGRDFSTLAETARGLEADVVIKASRLNLPEAPLNLRILRERLSFVGLRELYAASSVVVVPTLQTLNACGVSTILEAYAMGRPVVVTDNPGTRDFAIADETCLVVPPNDPDAMRAAIARLMAEPGTCTRLTGNARSYVERFCAVAPFAGRFAAALKKIAAL